MTSARTQAGKAMPLVLGVAAIALLAILLIADPLGLGLLGGGTDGSGDAAEAIPARVVRGWQAAAKRLSFAKALLGARNLSQEEYEALHDGLDVNLDLQPSREFVVERVGSCADQRLQDIGIEYYRYVL